MNEEIPVDYFLTAVQERWLIRDMNIDGAGIVQNYRKSFSRVIKQESFEKTQRFYVKNGFNEVARVSDYDHPGNDRVTFCKKLDEKA
jgi:hypothetical protein